jgi:hypothetical protein
MIRIDEIYNHTFWPWFRDNRSGTRLFFCDPPGRTDPEHLFNLGTDRIVENDYVFMHDQEPVDLELYQTLFDKVCKCNTDLWAPGPPEYYDNKPYVAENLAHWVIDDNGLPVKPTPHGHVVVSERGEFVDALCQKYEWTPHYYFYHGWACLDWFRGYNRTFLIPRASERTPTRTFMSPNRIVAGKRDHRVLFLYNLFKKGLEHNHISAPRVCQYERVDISIIAQKYAHVYQDITDVLNAAGLPRLFAGEESQEMHSYQLGNYTEAADSLLYVPTETVYFGRRTHLTEKTFKAIALEMPFVLVAAAHSLEYLRSYGFRTFAPYIDESYDTIADPIKRIERVTQILLDIQARSAAAKNQLWHDLLPVVEYNYRHFYRGGFRDVLEVELESMLTNLCSDLS